MSPLHPSSELQLYILYSSGHLIWGENTAMTTTSYGSYSGAIPTEKITWGKLDVDTPMFVIESDAATVAPLIFARVLGW